MYCLTYAVRYRALKTPQILELSGIGRRDVLDRIGVPLKLELPGVGENAQEHLAAGVSWGMYISNTMKAAHDRHYRAEK